MVKSTAVSCIHPDNYSVDRIISKEEEREDPRRDTSVFFEYITVVFPHTIHSTRTPVYRMPLLVLTSVISINNLHTIQQVSSHPVPRQLFYIQN